MKIIADGATDVGRVRTTNEDAFLVAADLGLFVVADGMGGHNAGEVASHLALETVRAAVANADPATSPVEVLRSAIEAANTAVVEAATADRAKAKMGTTLTALLIGEHGGVVGHVGDSRLYRARWGQIAKLTDDHTAVAELVRAGLLPEAEAATHPWAHILSRVIGRGDLEVQMSEIDVAPGDRFLLCSDGFSDSLADPSWLASLTAKPPAESAAELVARAVELDGKDNATAVVVAVGDEGKRRERRDLWKGLRSSVRRAIDALRRRPSGDQP